MGYQADQAKFRTYQDFADDFKRCRNPAKGRPIKGWCRLYKDGEDYVVKQVGWRSADVPLFRVSPSNVVTFVMPLEDLLGHTQTIVSSLYRVIPFTIERKRKGIYAVAGMDDIKFKANDDRVDWNKVRSQGAEYFNGIQFDLLSGMCMNQQPNMLDTIVPEKRKQWLKELKRFKKGLKIRAKVGALDALIPIVAKEKAEEGSSWRYDDRLPKWDSAELTQHVLECMRTESYPPDLLKLMVQTVNLGWRQTTVTRQMVLNNVDNVFDKHSLHYRKAFGVFGDTLHIKS